MSNIRIRLFTLIVVAYIFYVTNCFVQMVLPPNMIAVPILVLLGCLVLFPMQLMRDYVFLCALCYIVFLAIWTIFIHPMSGFGYGDGGINTAIIEGAFLLPAAAISSILSKIKDEKVMTSLFTATVVSLLSSLLFILPFVLFDNSVARMVSAREAFADEVLIPGFWNYAMLHMVVVFLPVFWGLASCHKGWKRILFSIIALMILVVCVQSSITTVFLIMLVSLIILFNVEVWRRKHLFVFVAELFILAFVVYKLPDITQSLLNYYDDTDMVEKLEDFQNMLEGHSDTNSTISGRAEYQEDSINAFLDNPVLGTSYEGGGHSIFLNRLASLGFVGFLPFLLMLIGQIIVWFRNTPVSRRIYYLIAVLGVIVLIVNKNVFGREGWLAFLVLVPVLLCYSGSRGIKQGKDEK